MAPSAVHPFALGSPEQPAATKPTKQPPWNDKSCGEGARRLVWRRPNHSEPSAAPRCTGAPTEPTSFTLSTTW